MRIDIRVLVKRLAIATIVVSVTACGITPPRTASTPRLLRYELAPVAAGSPFVVRRLRLDPPSTVDRSVGLGGLIGQTVNEVVPIPGTDMIRAGAVPEGSLFQNSFRNGLADAAGRAGESPIGATIVFRIDRP